MGMETKNERKPTTKLQMAGSKNQEAFTMVV
jgi:hypothetical protein